MERIRVEGSMGPINPALGYERVEKLYKRLYMARGTLRQCLFNIMEIQYLFQLDDNHEYVKYGHYKVIEILDRLEEVYLFFRGETERLALLLAEMEDPGKVAFLIDKKREKE